MLKIGYVEEDFVDRIREVDLLDLNTMRELAFFKCSLLANQTYSKGWLSTMRG